MNEKKDQLDENEKCKEPSKTRFSISLVGVAEPRLSGLDNSKKAIRLCWQQGESSVTVLGQERFLDAMSMLILQDGDLVSIFKLFTSANWDCGLNMY